jgi:hypothetical protein
VLRVARRFGLVAIAGELASHYGLTGWPEGEAERAAKQCFMAWLESFGGAGNREERVMLSQVRAFFEAHGASRFEDTNPANWNKTEKVINRAGFFRTLEDGRREFLVLPEAFKNEVCKGFDVRAVTAALIKAGWLEKGEGGRSTQKPRLPGLGAYSVLRNYRAHVGGMMKLRFEALSNFDQKTRGQRGQRGQPVNTRLSASPQDFQKWGQRGHDRILSPLSPNIPQARGRLKPCIHAVGPIVPAVPAEKRTNQFATLDEGSRRTCFWRWRVRFPDRALIVTYSPKVSREEVLADHPTAIKVEPVPDAAADTGQSGPLTPEDEAAIRAWLSSIGEDDETTIGEVIDACRWDAGARDYYLGRANPGPFDREAFEERAGIAEFDGGLPREDAEAIAWSEDERRRCAHCLNLRNGVCKVAEPGGRVSARQGYCPNREILHRCPEYRPCPDDPDRRPGRERWPEFLEIST